MAKTTLKPTASGTSKVGKSGTSSNTPLKSTIRVRNPVSHPRPAIKTTPASGSKAVNKRPIAGSSTPLGDATWSKTPQKSGDAVPSETPVRRGCLSRLLPVLLIALGAATIRARRRH